MNRTAQLARLLQVLGVESRVRIIQLLRNNGALCVGALAARLGISQSAVSQHLRILRDTGLVLPERRGYYIHYSLSPRGLTDCRRRLLQLLDVPAHRDGDRCVRQKGGETACALKRASVRSPKI